MHRIDEITQIVGQKFRSFGGGQENPYNPISMALKDQPLQFAAGVDIKTVVRVIMLLTQNKSTPPEPQHGHEPDKVKPLAQYLDEYIEHEVHTGSIDPSVSILYAWDSWRELLEQALDAYQSTENVTIKIERNT